jgi:hypothetical protein
MVVGPVKPFAQLQVYEPGELVQFALAPHAFDAAHSSTSAQVAGPPVIGVPVYPALHEQV